MAFTKYQTFLALLMVLTGSLNTLSAKWADYLSAPGSDGVIRLHNHPFVQAWFMFLGEFLCPLTFKLISFYCKGDKAENVGILRGNQKFSPFLFLFPAVCDMIATSLMYLGLSMTYASSYQILRGSEIVFVAILSRTFVGRKITRMNIMGISVVITGLIIVGLDDIFSDISSIDANSTSSNYIQYSTTSIFTGDVLVVSAQVVAACQMVYEEKYVVDKDIPPLQAVGWEGAFGVLILGLLMIPFYFISVSLPLGNNAHGVLEDAPDAIAQIMNNWGIAAGNFGMVFSISFFNFAGISITKEISATTRIILETFRTFVIWNFSILIGWQTFHSLQLIGFSILLCGMSIYYNIFSNLFKKTPQSEFHMQQVTNRKSPEMP